MKPTWCSRRRCEMMLLDLVGYFSHLKYFPGGFGIRSTLLFDITPIWLANQIGVMSNNKVDRIPNPPGKYFKWEKYPTKSSSIISHLLLEHQVGFTNRCIDIIYRYRELISKTSNLEIDQKLLIYFQIGGF